MTCAPLEPWIALLIVVAVLTIGHLWWRWNYPWGFFAASRWELWRERRRKKK